MNEATVSLEQRTIKKIMKRILPFVLLMYIIAFIDRVNMGYAALQMNAELALTAEVFGLLSGIFFVGYFFFEVPSNILLERFGARIWITRIMVTWGLVVILTGFVQSATHLYIVRFLLGVAEAGFFPGIILYLTYWFRSKERGRAYSLFLISMPLAGLVGAPFSTLIMDNISWFSLSGWRWMFIIAGILTVALGIVCLFYLTDRPKDAKWLTSEERDWIEKELENEKMKQTVVKTSKLAAFKNSKTWIFAFTYFGVYTGVYALSFWLPSIIDSFSGELSNTTIGFIAMIPSLAAIPSMVIWGRLSDKKLDKKMYVILPMILAAVGFAGTGLLSSPVVAIVCITLASMGLYSFTGPFFAMLSYGFNEKEAAVGIAAVNTLASLGGFFGPTILGYFDLMGGMIFIGGLLIAAFLPLLVMNRKVQLNNQVDSTLEKVNA
ncbi:MFS transporter [Niallia endozanthoxylica]|uniref:MFS transporter n=1 Tax=Niallia endozanthoxylica TaxID=2036016 RepID=A0A5J5I0L5_9BACI|nr:MFS transporter [Niallia endozanthoxylica]KAA9028463.1 MFS transporter [Niallia endozanthoxylica]